jgi:hypothetical protein
MQVTRIANDQWLRPAVEARRALLLKKSTAGTDWVTRHVPVVTFDPETGLETLIPICDLSHGHGLTSAMLCLFEGHFEMQPVQVRIDSCSFTRFMITCNLPVSIFCSQDKVYMMFVLDKVAILDNDAFDPYEPTIDESPPISKKRGPEETDDQPDIPATPKRPKPANRPSASSYLFNKATV